MEHLSENWITENHIDFEYKKYILLAYLQHVEEEFHETRLYPAMGELIRHYKAILSLRDSKKQLYESFPSQLSQADLQNFRLIYEKLIHDDRLMSELEQIIQFSLPQFEQYLNEGKKIYDFIESQIQIYPVGIVPIRHDFGYLLLKNGKESETRAYEYQISIFDQADDRYRSIGLHYIASFSNSLRNTYENIKRDLIDFNLNLPNPATYVIETSLQVPVDETLVPLAKRCLMKYIHVQGKA